jgi:hypothetical protein
MRTNTLRYSYLRLSALHSYFFDLIGSCRAQQVKRIAPYIFYMRRNARWLLRPASICRSAFRPTIHFWQRKHCQDEACLQQKY